MTISHLNLDDLSFQDIFESGRKKIPVYSKLWTNHNVSDPGITFLELFSWIAETQIYSLNRIRNSNKIKILKLLGTQIRPPTPSKIYVSLKTSLTNSITLTKGCRLTSTDFPELVFEVDEDNKIIPISVNKILNFSSLTGYKDAELGFDEDNPSMLNLKLFGDEVRKGNAFCIGIADNLVPTKTSNSEEGKVKPKEETVKIFIKLHDKEAKTESYNIKHNSTFDQYSNNVIWEFADGIKKDSNANWVILPPEKIEDETFGLTKSGIVTVKIPLNEGIAFRPFHVDSYHSEYTLNWLRCRLVKDNLDDPPIIDEIDLNTITALEGETTGNFEDLGRYEGILNQEFLLKNKPLEVLQILEVEEKFEKDIVSRGQENIFWKNVDDFDSSESSDRHFTLDCDKGIIKFGDGINGKPPKIGNQIFVKYRYGNLENRIIPKDIVFDNVFSSDLKNKIEGLVGYSKITITEGEKGESIEEAFARVQTEFATSEVGISKNDYTDIAMAAPGCNIARAATNANSKEGIVEVIIIPKSDKPNPLPTEDLLRTVQEHMNKHRMLTTQVFVKKPTYVEIVVDVALLANDIVTEKIVRKKLDSFLNPLPTEDTSTKEGYPMGKSVFKSDIVSELEEIIGVEGIESLSINAKSEKHENFGYEGSGIKISPTSFVFSSPNHNITIKSSKKACNPAQNKSKTGYNKNEF